MKLLKQQLLKIKYRTRREDAAELVRLECREKRRHLWQNTAHQIRPLVNSNMARGMASTLENLRRKRSL